MKNLIFLLLVAPSIAHPQQNISGCSELKELTIYHYPRNTTDQYKIVRTRERQVVYNMRTGDSAEYAITWTNDCRYSISIISSTQIKSTAQLKALQKSRLTYEVLSVTKEYYVYNMYRDQVNAGDVENRQANIDTAWLKPVASLDNYNFKLLTEKPAHLKRHFNDTSSYAIVYLYRLEKPAGALHDYSVFYEQDLMFRAQNRSKVAYKVYKEGPTKIHAKTGDIESSIIVNIEFGRKYYFQCLIHNKTPYPTPEIRLEEQTDGQIWYDSF